MPGATAVGRKAGFGIAPGAADYFTHGYGNPRRNVLFEGGERVERPGYLTDLFAARAISEIQDSARRRQPFLLSLHFNAPHWPWEGPGDAALAETLSSLRHDDGGSLEKYAEMVRADAIFSATGVTDGALLEGVHVSDGFVHTHTLVMNSASKTVREVRLKRPV